MNGSIVPLLCSFLVLFASSGSAFNITKILSEYPDYSNFNDLLTKTGLASEINTKSTITVLAIPNGAIGDLTSKSNDVVKRILTTHVVLDYYDQMKLEKMKEKTTKLTTMFQQSGKAAQDQGFLNVTAKDNSFVFGSAVKGAQLNSRLEKSVMSQPYNISILGISQAIVTPGIDGAAFAPEAAPPPKTHAPEAAPPPKAHAPEAAPPPKAHAPASSKKSSPPAESPADKEEEEEEAESPAEKENETEAPAPSKDADSPPADAESPSSAGKLKVSFGFFVVLGSMVAAY